MYIQSVTCNLSTNLNSFNVLCCLYCVLGTDEKYLIFSLKLFIVTVELMTLEGFCLDFTACVLCFHNNLIFVSSRCVYFYEFFTAAFIFLYIFCVANKFVESYGIITHMEVPPNACSLYSSTPYIIITSPLKMIVMNSLNTKYLIEYLNAVFSCIMNDHV